MKGHGVSGLMREIFVIEKGTRGLVELLGRLVAVVYKELAREGRLRELEGVREGLKEGLERQLMEVFHWIVRSRTEGLECLSRSSSGRSKGGAGEAAQGGVPPDSACRRARATDNFQGGRRGMSLVPSVMELILAEFLYLQYEDEEKPIYLYINSTGTTKGGEKLGYEMEAFAIL
ncbi:ATP-dependent Clp protease proteolytic subunit-related protein 4, chloroplastic [Iris pallida]|uniref:ATP-dependent Clp protease proteolytic subunit-related protein 4, chloroplastic n=1 Tax=Iris pallida TaxID=29817 RepID=A0AAX6FNJ3_IRIPA|nr:ATP-dependent Clp protease proteolytic subunit-related protein 4, chloroplastic [Iris pallida]